MVIPFKPPGMTGRSTAANVRFAADGAAIAPTLAEVAEARRQTQPHLVDTPVIPWTGPSLPEHFPGGGDVWLKLELLQVTGSFKPRGALNAALAADPAERARGFTAISSGNHAIAVAYAAHVLGTSAKVVMLESANPFRVAACRRYGGEIVFAPDGAAAVEAVARIQAEEGRLAIHPYEGVLTAMGVGGIALEIDRDVPDLDAIVLAIGGGGLCAGVAATLKQLQPGCEVLAVEPEGADTMFRSFRSGTPETLDRVRTIADSLAPPHSLPYSLSLCRQNVDELAQIGDDAIREAMRILFRDRKLAVEPGGAAALAGALGPFRERLRGKRVCVLVCGSNIDPATLARHLAAD